MTDPTVIREPSSGSWSIDDKWAERGLLHVAANAEDRNVTLVRRYVGETRPESIELHMIQIDALVDALVNAKAWLERAIAQQPPPDLPF